MFVVEVGTISVHDVAVGAVALGAVAVRSAAVFCCRVHTVDRMLLLQMLRPVLSA